MKIGSVWLPQLSLSVHPQIAGLEKSRFGVQELGSMLWWLPR